MGNVKGFLEFDRVDAPIVPEQERLKCFDEFHGRLSAEEQQKQAARCMNCGVPFCQAGMMIAGMASGCPLLVERMAASAAATAAIAVTATWFMSALLRGAGGRP